MTDHTGDANEKARYSLRWTNIYDSSKPVYEIEDESTLLEDGISNRIVSWEGQMLALGICEAETIIAQQKEEIARLRAALLELGKPAIMIDRIYLDGPKLSIAVPEGSHLHWAPSTMPREEGE